jgi:hypothetical protein
VFERGVNPTPTMWIVGTALAESFMGRTERLAGIT